MMQYLRSVLVCDIRIVYVAVVLKQNFCDAVFATATSVISVEQRF